MAVGGGRRGASEILSAGGRCSAPAARRDPSQRSLHNALPPGRRSTRALMSDGGARLQRHFHRAAVVNELRCRLLQGLFLDGLLL
ncbi:hypothetical protein EYF80_045642 [Liparis tanakae]|uniref:Uncharacterized protein n=1 Tax=Liparis tanakae TaxID=230148 RepID=A0A4Z2FV08_9TELE|nr:hypothetical protein EYF80_045642 [Liparis tanakae]